ncbi:hypothetical protein [Streptomyces sp. NPDC101149]|uniref:hypothetical protein n=1 Tax=Streptomyces sp. NPDC101149 TaxID=3366113 RepID=UPI0038089A55
MSGDGAAHGSDLPDGERLARALLTRVVEPGDEVAGRWLREWGAEELVRRLREGGRPLPGATGKRWAGMRARAARAELRRDWTSAREAGVRFVCPGSSEFCRQKPCCPSSCCV